jgi:signal transduction histidine kinase
VAILFLVDRSPPLDPARHEQLQRYRLRVTLVSLANSALQTVVMALYAWEGDLPWSTLAVFAPLALGVPAAFALLVASGRNLQFKDPALLVAQAVCACALQLGFVLVAPQLSVVFLVGLLITYNMVVLGLGQRQLTVAWAGLALVTGAVLWLVRDRFRYPGVNDLGLYALWLYSFLAVRQLTVVGVQCGTLHALLEERKEMLSQTVAQLHERAGDERLLERERISRELHDTLLQGVQGLVLRFQSAANSIPAELPARQMMEEALDRADRVLIEGRDKISALHEDPGPERDLGASLCATGEQLARDFGVRFRFELLGHRRQPCAQEDLYRLGREAMVRAFQRERAHEVSVQLHYRRDHVELRVFDDGLEKGAAAAQELDALSAGLNTRATRIGARLWSRRLDGGNELRLEVPSRRAA